MSETLRKHFVAVALGLGLSLVASPASAQGAAPKDPPPGSFRLALALPVIFGPEVKLDVISVGPGGQVIQGLGAEIEAAGGPRVALTGANGVVFKRLSEQETAPAFFQYLSEPIVTLADPRASRTWSKTAKELEACQRCDPSVDGVPAEARELLAGDAIEVRFPPSFRRALEHFYTSAQLDEAQLRIPSTRWEIVPSLEQEPAQSADFGEGDAAPGTLVATGEMTQAVVDLVVRGRATSFGGLDFAFVRTYRSGTVGPSPLGPGWEFGYRQRLRELPNDDVEHYDGRGRREVWRKQTGEGEEYEAPVGVFASLERTSAGWVLIHPDRTRVHFDRFGRLESIADALKSSPETGNELRFSYDSHSRLVRVRDTLERDFHLEYDDETGLLQTVRDPEGRRVRYGYEGGRLVSVTSPLTELDGSSFGELVTRYSYEPAAGDWVAQLTTGSNLKTVQDPKGQTWLELAWADGDGDGRTEEVVSQRWGEGMVTLAYSEGTTTVTDRRGNACTYQHNATGQRVRFEDATQAATTFEHDDEGLLTSVNLPLGGSVSYRYDTAGTRRSRGNLTQVTQTADDRGANGSPAALVTTIRYETATNQPIEIIDPRGTRTTIARDGDGLPQTVVEAAGSPAARTTTFEHNAFGQLTRVTNANGNVTTYGYSDTGASKGYLREQVVASGELNLRTTYTTDARGNVTQIRDPRGVQHTFTWSTVDWLLSQTLAAQGGSGAAAIAATTAYAYDKNGNVLTTTLPGYGESNATSTVAASYGLLDEVKSVTREIGGGAVSVESYEYDGNLNVTKILGDLGRQLELEYDERNLLAKSTRLVAPPVEEGAEPETIVEARAYDAERQLTATTDGRGQTWPLTRDGFGRVKRTATPLGHARELRYDANGNVTETRALDASEALLARTTVTYDRLNRPVETAQDLLDTEGEATGSVVSSTGYDALGNVLAVRDALGRESTFAYDAAERLVETRDAAGNRTLLELDPNANATRTTAFEQSSRSGEVVVTAQTVYDALNRPTERLDGLANRWQSQWDARGNLLAEIDPLGNTTKHTFDALGRKTRTEPPAVAGQSLAVAWGYDAASRLLTYTDASGSVTRYAHDLADRQVERTDPTGKIHRWALDPNGNVSSWTDALGTKVTQTFDVANRLVQRVITPGPGVLGPTAESFQFDGLDRLVRAQSGDVISQLEWDSLSRLTAETTNGRRVSYGLDAVGNRTTVTYPSGLALTQIFDPLDRPLAVSNAGTYGYRGPYRTDQLTYPGGLKTFWSYDAVRRPIQRFTSQPTLPGAPRPIQPSPMNELATWTPRGERSTVVGSGGLENGFQADYDPAGRLAKLSGLTTRRDQPTNNQLPPPAPPLWTEARAVNGSQALTGLGRTDQRLAFFETATEQVTLPPDARNAATELEQRQHGQLADRRPLTWDANGNLTAKGDLACRYDYRNRLVDVRDVVSGETLATFTYDAFNRRITKQTLSAQHETVWAGWRALEEHREGVLRWRKVYGGGLDEILRLEGDSDGNGTLESSYLPQYDQTGHLAALLDPTGKPVVRYAYSPSGDVTRTTIDPNAPRPTQLRIEGRTGIVVQFSEEISRDELEAALAASGIKVTRPANRNKAEIPLTLAPALERGPKARREWVLTLGEEPAAGEQVELLLDKWSVMDGFLNHPEEDLRFAITWPTTSATSRHILEDTDPPRVDLVVALDGHLEIELSEAPDEATLASAIRLNGQPHLVTLQADGFTLRSGQPLPLGDHLLEIETSLRDRAGRLLEQRFDAAFTWDGTTPALGIFKAESETTPTNLLRRSRADKDLIADLTGLNLGFQGQPYDPETGLYYFRNRFYDPELGRFITADPLGYVDGPSLYAAFGNDPVNGRDPLGLDGIIVRGDGTVEDEHGLNLYETLRREGLSQSEALDWVEQAGLSIDLEYPYLRAVSASTQVAGDVLATYTAVMGSVYAGTAIVFGGPVLLAYAYQAHNACISNPITCGELVVAGASVSLRMDGPTPVATPLGAGKRAIASATEEVLGAAESTLIQAVLRDADGLADLPFKDKGPVVARALDLETGYMSDSWVNVRSLPDDLDIVLVERLSRLSRPLHFSDPGTHAEVLAVNQLLLARRAAGLPVTEELFSSFMSYQHWLSRPYNPAPMCQNCSFILDGVISLSGSRK